MIRHKSLIMAMLFYWLATLAILMFLLTKYTDISHVWDIVVVFGTATAILTVWAYDYALKDLPRNNKGLNDRRQRTCQ